MICSPASSLPTRPCLFFSGSNQLRHDPINRTGWNGKAERVDHARQWLVQTEKLPLAKTLWLLLISWTFRVESAQRLAAPLNPCLRQRRRPALSNWIDRLKLPESAKLGRLLAVLLKIHCNEIALNSGSRIMRELRHVERIRRTPARVHPAILLLSRAFTNR